MLKIGTRDSALAVWQAEEVANLLKEVGVASELVKVKSPADIDLQTPLHAFGDTGIFTKMLDVALLQGDIDIAVHSLKDYPTLPTPGLALGAVLERADSSDILVYKQATKEEERLAEAMTIATGSVRRRAQWLHRYPKHQMTGLRGNVQTRLAKLEASDWAGAIFAKAGLERVNVLPQKHEILDWMIPAPAQGTIGVVQRTQDRAIQEALAKINHLETALATAEERAFLRAVEGGCSAPVGALVRLSAKSVEFKGAIFEPDGSAKVDISKEFSRAELPGLGTRLAELLLRQGGSEIMKKIRNGSAN